MNERKEGGPREGRRVGEEKVVQRTMTLAGNSCAGDFSRASNALISGPWLKQWLLGVQSPPKSIVTGAIRPNGTT